MAKAYDRMDWSFLISIMEDFGFDALWMIGYGDDMIIFDNGQKQSVRRVLQCIEHYEGASGQLLNRDKSGIILPKRFSTSQIHRLENLTGFRHQHQPFTYLGVPLFKGAIKIFLYDDLVQKVWSRIFVWASRLLSFGGTDYLDSISAILYSSLSSSDYEASQCYIEEVRGFATKSAWQLVHTGHSIQAVYDLWIESDYTLAIHCITRGGGPWSIQVTLCRIRHLLTFDRDTISHIYREGNQVADLFASEGWDRRCYFEYSAQDLPRRYRSLAQIDKHGIPTVMGL
ncbi:Uncharacterized protein Adt_22555 [Abeliophyllum distichum]|uniref:Reverse transcriptase domain-containing protein n=1 Tax=Abeliophyllum distichum TaxID=126358 RepID=A0ABD1T2K2_9LAMI